jgi:hypothetical protein
VLLRAEWAKFAASVDNSGHNSSSRGTRYGASPAALLIAIVFTFASHILINNFLIETERGMKWNEEYRRLEISWLAPAFYSPEIDSTLQPS